MLPVFETTLKYRYRIGIDFEGTIALLNRLLGRSTTMYSRIRTCLLKSEISLSQTFGNHSY